MRVAGLYVLLLFGGYANAQFSEQQIISTDAAFARSVYAVDLDGDGDIDVLSASEHDDKIAWYENDGLGNFGIQNVITQDLSRAVDVYSVDLDGDGDFDVLAAAKGISQFESKVVWFRNLDGQGNFSNEIIISEEIQGAISVFAVDLDGDLDLDVLTASFTDNKVAWYENDGLGNFGAQQIITATAYSTREVFAADLDGDNDMDVLSVSPGTDKVIWFENEDGLGNFSDEIIIASNANAVGYVFAADLDGDNDLDVLSARSFENTVAWYENFDGLGNFGSEQIITQNLISATGVFVSDLDNDGDNDVLSGSANDDKVVWYENLNGLGNFGSEQIISTQTDWARSVYTADLDGDGDMDVLSASSVDNKIAWYENLTLMGVNDFSFKSITLHPNPVNDIVHIENNSSIEITSLSIYSLLGELLLSKQEDFNQIDISSLTSGVYFLKVVSERGEVTKKFIKD
jgi:hypothetical protein